MEKLLIALGETIRLAIEHEKASQKLDDSLPEKGGHVFDLFDIDEHSPEYQLCQQKEKELREYLETLDFEMIKDIQSIMYLGRDGDYDREESFQQRFSTQRKYMDSLGWKDKSIEVNQMVEKLPLADYLKNGMRILGLQ